MLATVEIVTYPWCKCLVGSPFKYDHIFVICMLNWPLTGIKVKRQHWNLNCPQNCCAKYPRHEPLNGLDNFLKLNRLLRNYVEMISRINSKFYSFHFVFQTFKNISKNELNFFKKIPKYFEEKSAKVCVDIRQCLIDTSHPNSFVDSSVMFIVNVRLMPSVHQTKIVNKFVFK